MRAAVVATEGRWVSREALSQFLLLCTFSEIMYFSLQSYQSWLICIHLHGSFYIALSQTFSSILQSCFFPVRQLIKQASQVVLVVKNLSAKAGDKRCRFDPWVRKNPWRRAGQLTPGFLIGESHGQRSLVGYSPWGRKEQDVTEATESACTAKQAAHLFCPEVIEYSNPRHLSSIPSMWPIVIHYLKLYTLRGLQAYPLRSHYAAAIYSSKHR